MSTKSERKEITKRMKSEITAGLEGEVETITRHGAYLLNAFTNDLYTDFAQASKEYISNSVDAEAKEIRIRCQHPDYQSLVITDDGDFIRTSFRDLKSLMKHIYIFGLF